MSFTNISAAQNQGILLLRKPYLLDFHLVTLPLSILIRCANFALSHRCIFVGYDTNRWSSTWHQEHHPRHPKRKKSAGYVMKNQRKCPIWAFENPVSFVNHCYFDIIYCIWAIATIERNLSNLRNISFSHYSGHSYKT